MFSTRRTALSLFVAFAAIHAHSAVKAQVPAHAKPTVECESLTQLTLPRVRISDAVSVPAPSTGVVKVAHCRVSGIIDKETRFTELLPLSWNGRFFAGGGGGFVGSVANQALATVNLGYATVGTDTGHEADGTDASWALGNPERLRTYGFLAIHRTAEVAKAVIKAYYGNEPRYSYFFGCSNGGRQGLMEVQRYPADFDGVVSCAPALDFTNIAASFVRNAQVVYPDPKVRESVITSDNLQLLELKVLEKCDARDGVKDSVLEDPRSCDFQAVDLPSCPEDRASANCVTKAQRAAIQRIYAPITSQRALVYPGQPFGGEGQPAGWPRWITGRASSAAPQGRAASLQFVFGTEFFKYFVFGRSDWDYSTYDLSTWRRDTRAAAEILNADNPDLSAFKARGGKLIMAHGWADPALNALTTIAYYERVRAGDRRVNDYVRLFMMPGVLHCVNGAGPDSVDWFTPIAEWVEQGRGPTRLIAEKRGTDGRILNARPLCPYPLRAVYDGKGSTTDAASFACKQ